MDESLDSFEGSALIFNMGGFRVLPSIKSESLERSKGIMSCLIEKDLFGLFHQETLQEFYTDVEAWFSLG